MSTTLAVRTHQTPRPLLRHGRRARWARVQFTPSRQDRWRVLSALIGLSVGGPVGALAGGALTPVAEELVRRSWMEIFADRGKVLERAAEHAAGRPAPVVVESVLAERRLQPLLLNILDVAARTDNQQKLATLGHILGEQVGRCPRALEEALIVSALRDLEAPHVRLLDILKDKWVHDETGRPQDYWPGRALERAATGLTSALTYGALGGLVRHGLARSHTLLGSVSYTLTDFGRAMHAVLAASREY